MTYLEQINEGIKESMRSKDFLRLNTLRMLKTKILTVDARGNVKEADIVKLFKAYLGNLQEALDQNMAINRLEEVEKLKGEMAVVLGFLPKALSREETENIIAQAIDESQAKSKKDLGLVMKAAMKINSGIDGKLAKELADQRLSN
jgi:uncharacterized protein YqeY